MKTELSMRSTGRRVLHGVSIIDADTQTLLCATAQCDYATTIGPQGDKHVYGTKEEHIMIITIFTVKKRKGPV
jgi:hypothetical protein